MSTTTANTWPLQARGLAANVTTRHYRGAHRIAPAVFVRKKSGDIRLCVDYRELNKRTQKDTYPLLLPDEVQDKLANSEVFSTLDLQCGYWQVPVNPQACHKTAFCPAPSMGFFQLKCMPFGLTGAPSSFQRLMKQLLRNLPFVTVY